MVFENPRIHRLCCRKNKRQDEQDHPHLIILYCYLEHRLMVDHRGQLRVRWKRICLFVEKQYFAVPNRRNLIQTKKRKKRNKYQVCESRKWTSKI